MIRNQQNSTSEEITHQAAKWFARMLESDLADQEYSEFSDWLQSDERHAAAYAKLEKLWQTAGSEPLQPGSSSSRRTVLKTAGSLIALGAIAGGLGLHQIRKADFETGIGQRQLVTLDDGSEVELSAATSVSLAFSQKERRILLHSGEVYCRVAKDPTRPFVVQTGSMSATALGTAYSVRSYDDHGASVTVTEHDVLVETSGSSKMISAGETVDTLNCRILPILHGENENRLAWTRGSLVFLSTPLGEVISSLNRWRNGRLVILDDELATRLITAIIDVSRIETIDQTLADGLDLDVTNYTPWLTLVSAK